MSWPASPQDAVLQDAPPVTAPLAAPVATAPSRWSGRRTAGIAAIALALTSAGAIAAAAASPDGIAGTTEQHGPGGRSSNRQAGPGAPGQRDVQPGQQGQQGQQGVQPGQGARPGRGNH